MNYRGFRTSIFATIIGNMMEWFDYALIGYIAPRYIDIYPQEAATINPLFFIYSASLIARPIGAIIFSYLGDVLGRRLVLILTITMMATGALFAALLPRVYSFSLLTPVLLLLILMIHNLSAGGESPATVTYLYETAPVKLRPFATSWVYFGFFVGVFLSTADFSSLYWELKLPDFLNWGWRLPFLFSAFIGFLGLSFRKRLHETPLFNHEKNSKQLYKNPLKILLTNYKQKILLGFGVLALNSIGVNLLVIFAPTYFQKYLGRTADETLTLCIFSIMIAMLSAPLGGYLTLHFDKTRLLKWATAALFVLTLPIYFMLQASSIIWLFFANGLFAFLIAQVTSLTPTIICELFPTTLRCSGYGLCRNFPVPLLEGFSPILLSWIIGSFKVPLAPAFLIILGSSVSLYSLFILGRLKQTDLVKE